MHLPRSSRPKKSQTPSLLFSVKAGKKGEEDTITSAREGGRVSAVSCAGREGGGKEGTFFIRHPSEKKERTTLAPFLKGREEKGRT